MKSDEIYQLRVSVKTLVQLTGSDSRSISDIFRAAAFSPVGTVGNVREFCLGDALRVLVSFRRRVDREVEIDGQKMTLEEAKTRDLTAAAKAKEWKLERDKGQYLPREQVEQDFDALARVIVAWVDGLPSAVPDAMKTEIKRELERGIRSLE